MHEIESPLLDETEAAEYLRVAVATLRRWRWAGKPPGFNRIGGRVRYERNVLDAFIASCRRRSTTDQGAGAAQP
ncbi:MAG: helix-turn-helix domain-containing protein [Phycisphaerae bacterium]